MPKRKFSRKGGTRRKYTVKRARKFPLTRTLQKSKFGMFPFKFVATSRLGMTSRQRRFTLRRTRKMRFSAAKGRYHLAKAAARIREAAAEQSLAEQLISGTKGVLDAGSSVSGAYAKAAALANFAAAHPAIAGAAAVYHAAKNIPYEVVDRAYEFMNPSRMGYVPTLTERNNLRS